MALTEATPREMRALGGTNYTVKDAVILYEGAIACYDANDELLPGADTAGLQFAGILTGPTVDNTDDGEECIVDPLTPYHAAGTGFAAGDVGTAVFVSDDNTVAKSTTNKVWAGNIIEVVSSTEVVVMPPRAVELKLTDLTFTAQAVADPSAAGSTNDAVSGVSLTDVGALGSTDGAISALTAPAAVTPTLLAGDFTALTFSVSPTQGECEALRDKCETLLTEHLATNTALSTLLSTYGSLITELEAVADDARGLRTVLGTNHTELATLIAELENIGDDARVALAAIAAVITADKALGLLTDPS